MCKIHFTKKVKKKKMMGLAKGVSNGVLFHRFEGPFAAKSCLGGVPGLLSTFYASENIFMGVDLMDSMYL